MFFICLGQLRRSVPRLDGVGLGRAAGGGHQEAHQAGARHRQGQHALHRLQERAGDHEGNSAERQEVALKQLILFLNKKDKLC